MVLKEFITVSSDHYQKGNVVIVLEQYLVLIEKKWGDLCVIGYCGHVIRLSP